MAGNSMSSIKHIVHIMFENRSLDNVLGWLYSDVNNVPSRNLIDNRVPPIYYGLKPNTYFNYDNAGNKHYVTRGTGGSMTVPDPDPNEEYQYVNNQCFGSTANPRPGTPATMSGFYKDYQSVTSNAGQIMQTYSCFDKRNDDLTIINALARYFAVCDKWYASIPTQTNCNRGFAGAGNSIGPDSNGVNTAWVNNHFDWYGQLKVSFNQKTHWNVLYDNGFTSPNDWSIFYSETWPPDLGNYCFTRDLFWAQLGNSKFNPHFAGIDTFFAKAKSGNLPSYSFLEPKWGLKIDGIGLNGNDYHPPCNVFPGEEFLLKIYSALSDNQSQWMETLLVITFDEHGGTYDHIPTPWGATPPWGTQKAPPCELSFGFDRFGVRVPAILVSPYIQRGTVFRAPEGKTPFDHTSFIATLLNWKGIPKSKWGLGERVANAPTFEDVLQLPIPQTDLPELQPLVKTTPQDPNIPISHLQREIAERAFAHAVRTMGIDQAKANALYDTHLAPVTTIGELAAALGRLAEEIKK